MSAAIAGGALALAGLLSGLLWRLPTIGALDAALFLRINASPTIGLLDHLLRLLRPLGTVWALWPACAALALLSPPHGLSLALCGAIVAGVERAVKLAVGRRRPYQDLAGVQLRVPAPVEAGFPSGDAARVGLLAAALSLWSGGAVLGAAAAALAMLAALGRVRGGVHYPLDVWAGAWLGVGAAIAWAGLSGLV